MKRNTLLPAIIIASLATALAQAQTVVPSRVRFPQHQPNRPSAQALTPRTQSPRLATMVSPDIWVTCPSDALNLDPAVTCGKLPVPLDRRHPDGAKIKIYFEVYPHTNPGPAESAILANPGGPGLGTTFFRGIALTLFAQNLDVHDLLLIDDRGRGFSAAINCGELQHGTASFEKAESDCAAQLGDADSLYGTGDVAMDTDAVRAALGYDKVDYWGGSYGGEDVTAYATLFGQHLRSIVLDAPDGTPGLEAFSLDGNEARSTVREVRLDCQRSPTCSVDHSDPGAEFVRLIQVIRSDPIQGWVYDPNGNSVLVTLDEGALLYLAINGSLPGSQFIITGELLAAGESLSHGDSAPLLRLGAEVIPLVTDYGDPTSDSQGDYFATLCVDAQQPWNWSAPVAERAMQFADAVEDLPSDHFAPFSKVAGTSLGVSLEKQCLWWQKPNPSSPVTPSHPSYPNVPTLVLDGDMDTSVPMEEARKVAALFPQSTFIKVAEAGHVTWGWSSCAANLESQFFETLQVGDKSCTETPETFWPALGRFPLTAADARPAQVDPAEANEIGVAERRVVSVAVATAMDALKRTALGPIGGGATSGNGVGLRAGTFESTVDANGNETTSLKNCSFATDVAVNGTVTWASGSDMSLVADLVVTGSGTAGGALHIDGAFDAPGPVGSFKISGVLGGRKVAVLVPEG
ncbi:MAG: alpha/beta fold hydrolase [Gammaproteobacteria bacterium]|nr:alpha/beta fold hydrolase [Gammaproteobacteria bacterium]